MRKRGIDGNGQQEYDMEQTYLVKKTGLQLPARAIARADIAARCRWQLGCIVGVLFLLLPPVQHYLRPPDAVWKATLAASLVFLAYKILTFTRWADEYPYVTRFLICITAMVVELLGENVMVWIVSATDIHKYDDPLALQDNGEILFKYLAGRNALLAWFIYGKWWNIVHFLGAVLCLAFSVAWDQHPYSGFGVMSRFCLTICLSRTLRTVCFMSTVLPSPQPGCYRRRFPPPPDTLWGMLKVGITQLRGFGGCNDLIFSGHGAFWTLAPLTLQAYYPNRLSTNLLWIALAQTSIRDVVDKQHYTVDMFLAVVVTWAVWYWLDWVYPPQPLPLRPKEQPGDKPNLYVLSVVVFGLLTAAVAVFVAKS